MRPKLLDPGGLRSPTGTISLIFLLSGLSPHGIQRKPYDSATLQKSNWWNFFLAFAQLREATMAKTGYTPWHEVVTLRDELRSGDLALSVFAADLYDERW